MPQHVVYIYIYRYMNYKNNSVDEYVRDGHSQTLADSESNHKCRIQNFESSFRIQNLGG